MGSLQTAWMGEDCVGRNGEQRGKHKYMGRGENGAGEDKRGVTDIYASSKEV